ncbi:MAG: class I tRNA ligase family protein, partial [Clostridia bacterium]|nr:class I tRNA ligase family protein [Clostridia bacterium]
SSLLTSVGSGLGGAPYKAVLTHGWTVDGEGKAMHKSLGNVVAPESIINVYGADILRFWVASSDYRVDVRCSDAMFRQLSESYRKIRNTCRILLADLGTPDQDFNPATDQIPFDRMPDIDRWALSRLNRLVRSAREAYDRYEFHTICHDVLNFCSIDLSKLYVDITKDRPYCNRKDAPERRSAQTVMYLTVKALARILAPILSYTAEELWGYISLTEEDDPVSVFCNPMPAYREDMNFPDMEEKYDGLFDVRDDVMKALELSRADKVIGKSLEAKVTIFGAPDSPAMKLFASHRDELEEIFIVSRVELSSEPAPEGAFRETQSGIAVLVEVAGGRKCSRCWVYRDDCEPDGEDDYLCPRCRAAVRQ